MTSNRNSLILAAGLAVGVFGSATSASADTFGPMDTSGFVEMFGAHSFLTDVGPSADDDRYTGGGGGGQVNFWLSDSHTVQIDGDIDFFRNDPDDDTEFAIEMLVHAGWRDPARGYFGGFGGIVTIGYAGDSSDPAHWVAGGEGAIYLDMMTVFAQAGFMDELNAKEADDGGFTDSYFVRGGVRYFVNPNLKLEASGGFLSGDEYGGNTPVDIPFWRFEVEHKPDDGRVSWFASYIGHDEDEEDYQHTAHTVMGGIRIHFGQDTLMSVDRSGASQGFLDSRMLQIADDQ